MTKLLWTLARHDCLAAQLLLVLRRPSCGGESFSCGRPNLECRARSRDPGEPWQPVLAERDRAAWRCGVTDLP